MSIAKALTNNASPVISAQKAYKEHVVFVNTYVNGVLSSQLPALNNFPPDWDAFQTAYTAARADAMEWVNNVMSRLLTTPDSVRNYNDTISQVLQNAHSQAIILQNDPSDNGAKSLLRADMQTIKTTLSLVSGFVTSAIKQIEGFQSKIPDMAKQLHDIAQRSINDANADQNKINNLKNSIASLQQEVDSLVAAIVGLGIADAAAVTLGVVASIAAFPIGLIAWLFLGPVIAIATTYIVIDAEKIKALKAQIKQDQDQISGISADVATLTLLAQNYQQMADKTEDLKQHLQSILDAWNSLESEMGQAINDVNTAIADGDAAAYDKVKNDLEEAVTAWNDAYAKAGGLHLDLKVNNAQLEVGMSEQQIKDAMSKATTMDLLDYYAQQSAVAVA